MRICSIAKGPLKERAFLLAYEMASGNLKHCARVGRDQGGSIKGANVFSFNPRARAGRDGAAVSRYGAKSVSIHAPTRGATRACRFIRASLWRFNPRARAGRDADFWSMFGTAEVSIHAPARGATRKKSAHASWLSGFNPRARAGRDWNSTCPHGHTKGFNPRARAGRDPGFPPASGVPEVSIHAPARGATRVA